MRLETTGRDLHAAIDEAWEQDRTACCPECEGQNLTIDLPNMRCRDCDPDPEIIGEPA